MHPNKRKESNHSSEDDCAHHHGEKDETLTQCPAKPQKYPKSCKLPPKFLAKFVEYKEIQSRSAAAELTAELRIMENDSSSQTSSHLEEDSGSERDTLLKNESRSRCIPSESVHNEVDTDTGGLVEDTKPAANLSDNKEYETNTETLEEPYVHSD